MMISFEKEKIERVVWVVWSYVGKHQCTQWKKEKKSDSMSRIMNGYTRKHANIQNK